MFCSRLHNFSPVSALNFGPRSSQKTLNTLIDHSDAEDYRLTSPSRHDEDAEVSPSTNAPGPSSLKSGDMAKIAPWDQPESGDLNNHRKDLRVLENAANNVPSISKQPPPAASPNNPSWAQHNPVVMPTSVFGSFFNDSSDDIPQLSPGFRPGSSQYGDGQYPGDDRRPSVASATTVSSQGSKSSVGRGFHKKLQNVFGEDFPGLDSRQGSDLSLAPDARLPQNNASSRDAARKRNNSSGDVRRSRPSSPFSRPRTPMASSEVIPWEYQDGTFGKVSSSRPTVLRPSLSRIPGRKLTIAISSGHAGASSRT